MTAFRSAAEREPNNAVPRAQLGDLYFGSERFDDALKWYEQALELTPNDVRVSSQLAMTYYYTNQTDRALQQLERSTQDRSEARGDLAEPRLRPGVREAGSERRGTGLAAGDQDRA